MKPKVAQAGHSSSGLRHGSRDSSGSRSRIGPFPSSRQLDDIVSPVTTRSPPSLTVVIHTESPGARAPSLLRRFPMAVSFPSLLLCLTSTSGHSRASHAGALGASPPPVTSTEYLHSSR